MELKAPIPINLLAEKMEEIGGEDENSKYAISESEDKNIFNLEVFEADSSLKKYIIKIHKDPDYCSVEVDQLLHLREVEGVPRIIYYRHSPELITTQIPIRRGTKISKEFILKPKYLNYIIMERLEGLDLFRYCSSRGKRLSENEAKPIFKNILLVLKRVHKLGIVHKDIKPENIVINPKTLSVHIIDFEQKKSTNYQSPEQAGNLKVNSKTDVWSAGILLYWMLTFNFPFQTKQEIIGKPLRTKSTWSEDLVDFFSCVLDRCVETRYSVEECLNHTWLDN